MKNTFEGSGLEKNHFVNLSISYLLIYIIFMSTISFAAGGNMSNNQSASLPEVRDQSASLSEEIIVVPEVALDEEIVSEENITEANPDSVEENITIFENKTEGNSSSQIPQIDIDLNETIENNETIFENKTEGNSSSQIPQIDTDFENATVEENFTIETNQTIENETNQSFEIELEPEVPVKSIMGDFKIQSMSGGVAREGYGVQSGTYDMIGTDEFIPLTREVLDLNHAFVIAPNMMNQKRTAASTGTGSAINSDDAFVSLYLYNSTHIRAQRAVGGEPVVVTWQTLEAYDEEFRVQRGNHNFVGTGVLTTDNIPTSVNPANSMSWFYIKTTYAGNNGDVIQFYSDITDANTIKFERATGTTSTNVDFRWIVVEWDTSKIDNFAKGYTGGITGADTSADCFNIGKTIDKSSSIMFHQVHSMHTGTGGLDSSARAGYIQDNNNVCFYDHDGVYNAGVKWFVIDFKDSTQREENIHVDWSTTDYVDDVVFSGSYDSDKTLAFVSGSCNGDGTAKPRHTQWFNFNGGATATGLHIERTYGGQNREYSWQVLELPYFENVNAPSFSSESASSAMAVDSANVRFSVDVLDSDSVSQVNGTIEGVKRTFVKGSGNLWYYDYTCNGDKTVSFSYVEAIDGGRPARDSNKAVSGVNVVCDAGVPIVNFVSPNTPANDSSIGVDSFMIDATVVEANFKNVTFALSNQDSIVSSQTYIDGTRSHSFSGLSSGVYFYNVTAYDLAGNKGFSETRKITIDSESPLINYDIGTNVNNAIISGNQIFINVAIADDNFKEVVFNLFGPQNKINPYTDSTRSVNWNLLPDGDYEYNVTAYDIYNHANSTLTRRIVLDNQAPVISFETGVEDDGTYFNRNYIYVNTSVIESHFKNITFSLSTQDSVVSSQTFTDGTRAYNFTGLGNEEYFYNVTACDLANNCETGETRKLTLDSITPVVNFGAGTDIDSSVRNRNWIYVEADTTDVNFENITFELYDNGGKIVSTDSFTDGTRKINWSGLNSGAYSYNFTVYDKAGNKGSVSSRTISLDLVGPSITIIDPKTKAYSDGANMALNYNVVDALSSVDICWYNIDDGTNITTACGGSSTFTVAEGVHNLNFYANDTFGYLSDSSVQFRVSTAGPIVILGVPIEETFYSAATNVFFNYSLEDLTEVDTCSLYGNWGAGWHLEESESGFRSTNGDDKTCDSHWGFDCGIKPGSGEQDNTWDDCGNGANTDEEVENIYLNVTSVSPGEAVEVVCEYDPYGTQNKLWTSYYDGNSWSRVGAQETAANGNLVSKTRVIIAGSTLGTHWVRCSIDYNQNDLDECAGGSYYDNDDVSFEVVESKEPSNFTVQINEEGNYEWNVICNDTNSNIAGAFTNNTFTVDLDSPIVSFGIGTPADSSRRGINSLFIDANIIETNLKNVTFSLSNWKSEVSQKTFTDGTMNYTFTGLSSGAYEYNITAYDKAGRVGVSETRSIEIDVVKPTGSNNGPSNGFFTKIASQNLTATVNDLTELKDATLMVFNSTGNLIFSSLVALSGFTTATIGVVYTFLYDDIFNWFYKVEDSVGNQFNTTAHSIEIDTTAPVITFVSPTEDSGKVVLQDWIYLNVNVYEANYKNVTFNLHKEGSIPLIVSFSDATRSVNWTSLTNGIYEYNVTGYDKAGNFGASETRTIILDTISPIIDFSLESIANNEVITGKSISVSVDVTEPNEKEIRFNLYDKFGVLVLPTVSYIDSRRSMTWNNLNQNSIYYYNVTVKDDVELEGSTETRKITLDNTLPVVDFGLGVEINNSNKSRDWIYLNASVIEDNFANITFAISNQTSIVSSQTFSDGTREYNFTGLTNGDYYYNVTVYDLTGKSSSAATRNIKLDTISPIVNFASPTEDDLVVRSRDWVYINTTVVENDFKEIRFELYDQTTVVQSIVFSDNTRGYNFTGLSDNNYLYNVTVVDFAGNIGKTETRHIGLDSAGPIVNIVKPRVKTYGYNTSIPLEHTVSDTVSNVESCWWNIDGGANQSIICNSATTFDTTVAPHTINFYANDTFGNIGSDSVNFFISITGPAIELVSPVNDKFYGVATDIDFSFGANDPDAVEECSLYGDWNGGWKKNETYIGNWKDVGFKHRQDITINNLGSSLLTNYPAYFNITSDHTDSGDYYDLKFFSGSCSSPGAVLNYEIESYNSESATVWVNVPSLPVLGTTVCMYYGNENAEDNQNVAATWNSNHAIVYHMGNSGVDSTLNNNDMKGNVGNPVNDDSFLGEGISFSNNNAWSMTDLSWWEIGYSTRTHEVVFETGSDTSSRQVLFAEGGTTNGIMLYVLSGQLYARWWIASNDHFVSTPIQPNAKYHAVMTYQNGGVDTYALYLNGVQVGSGVPAFDVAAHSGNGAIGYTGDAKDFEDLDSLTGYYFTGSIYEFRGMDSFQTNDWAKQTYGMIFNEGSTVSYETPENFVAFSVPVNEEGIYKWNVECNDTIGYVSQALSNYTFIVDVTSPAVFFGADTQENNANVGVDFIYISANIIENNFKNITFDLWNGFGSKVQSRGFSDDTRNYNFTGLSDGNYYYNVTVYDRANHIGYSETRKISLDTISPVGNLNSPSDKSFVKNVIQNLTASFSDATGLLNATLYIFNEAGTIVHTSFVELGGVISSTFGIVYNFATEGIYKWFYSVEDVVGNVYNTTNNTLNVDLTAPLIDYTIGTEATNGMFERENIFVNVTASDWSLANITFNLYNDEGEVFSHMPGVSEINWTFLADDTYYYNVTAYDVAGNSNSTKTRSITLDNLAPVIDFGSATLNNGAYKAGDTVSFDVVVAEPNEEEIVFYLYNSTNHLIRETEMPAGTRSISWNLLPEGTYYYNATVYDLVGHKMSTGTRSMILDATLPVVSYGAGTLINDTYTTQDFVYVKANVVETNFKNVTFELWNSSGSRVESREFSDTTREYNFTGLSDGVYYYNISSSDKAGNVGKTLTRTVTLDSTSPVVDFGGFTLSNNTNNTNNWIYVDANILETNFKNVTFSLFDNNGEFVKGKTFIDSTRNYNFTNLGSKVYLYNITTYDKAGNKGISKTRKIGLDYIGPSISILNPKPKAYGVNVSLPLDYIVTDAIVGNDKCWYNIDGVVNTTVDCSGSTTYDTSNGQHVLNFYANDTFGNMNYKNVTFLISVYGPAVQLVEPVDNVFYSAGKEVFFNYTAEDPDNVDTCSLYGSWNGGWHLNASESGFATSDDTDVTCNEFWVQDCALDTATEFDNTFDDCETKIGTDEMVRSMTLNATSVAPGQSLELTCTFDVWSTDNLYFWYYNGTAWRKLHEVLNYAGGTVAGYSVSTTFIPDNVPGQQVVRCGINYNEDAEADSCTNTGSYYDNDDINFTVVEPKNPSGFKVNLSEEGKSSWNIMCNDSKSYDTWAVANYSITFDVTNPVVDFGVNTLADDTNVSQNFVYVNSNIIENNFDSIEFYLYDETGSLKSSKWFNDTTRDYAFNNLVDGVYYYNMTVWDKANRNGSSSTRKIMLDTKAPVGNLGTPNHNSYVKESSQNLTASFSDENGLKEAMLFVFNSTGYLVTNPTIILSGLSATIGVVYDFLKDDVFTWFYQVEDSVGNKFNTTSKDLIVDTTLPIIDFEVGTLTNNSYASQKNIYVNVSLVETNFENITFSLDNSFGLKSKNTFSNSRRDINWTNLVDDKYNYTVTVWDKAGNVNSSESRVVTLDNVVPAVNYESETEINFANKSQDYIYVKTSLYDLNFANVTYEISNASGVVNSTTFFTEVNEINWTDLSDGIYEYNVTVYDKAGLSKSLPSRTITLDTISPLVSFVSPTEVDSVNLEQEWIYAKVIVSELNFKEILFNLYDNKNSLINSTKYSTLVNEINFTASSENKTYSYEVSVTDFAGNSKSTVRRNINLVDVTNPTLVLKNPQNKTYSYNNGIRLDYEAMDVHLDSCFYSLNGAANKTLPGCSGVSLNLVDETQNTIDLFVNDTLGYMNSTSVTFFVNSSLILTPTYQVIRGSSFVDQYKEESVDQIDSSKSFILHNVRGQNNGPDSLQVISKFLDVNTIAFEHYASSKPVNVEWSLVVGPGIKTQRGESQYTNEETIDISINPVNLSSSFIIVNNKLNSVNSVKNAEGYWSAEFIDDSTLRVTRGSGSASGVLSWQVVDWKSVLVESGSLKIEDGSSENSTVISNVDLTKSFLISNNNLVSGTQVDDVMVKSEFVDNSNIKFSRVGNQGESTINYFVVSSDLFDVQSGSHAHALSSSPQDISLGYDLTNKTRAFDLNSHDNSGATTSFSTASVTQTIKDDSTLSLQKGSAIGSGESSWFAIEIKDLNAPVVSLVSPGNSHNYSSYNIPVFSYSVEDESLIKNCSLYGDFTGSWKINQTVSGKVSFSGITVPSSGFYKWAVSCTDIYGNANMSMNKTFGAFLPPTEPVFFESKQTANDGTGDIILNWTATVDTLEYRIYSGESATLLTLLGTTTDTNYTDTTFVGSKRRFYRVEAWNPSSTNMSTETIGAHVYTLRHNPSGKYKIKDRNWIGFPTNFTNIKNANETLNEITGVTAITRYDATKQKRVTCNEFSCPTSFACTDTACNFDLKAGEGYEVNLNMSGPTEVNWSDVGVVYSPQDVTLVYDETGTRFNKNWVSMTAYTTIKNTLGLKQDIGVSDGITRWDSKIQNNQGLIPHPFIPGSYMGAADLIMEEGYEVGVTEDKLWRQA